MKRNYAHILEELRVGFPAFLVEWSRLAATTKATGVVIFVCKNLSPKEKVVTMAHELGHWFKLDGRKVVQLKECANEGRANTNALIFLQALDSTFTAREYQRVYRYLAKCTLYAHKPGRSSI